MQKEKDRSSNCCKLYITVSFSRGKNLRPYFLDSEMRQKWPFPSLLFTIVLETLDRKIRQEKKINRIQIEKGEVKLFLFIGNVLYI